MLRLETDETTGLHAVVLPSSTSTGSRRVKSMGSLIPEVPNAGRKQKPVAIIVNRAMEMVKQGGRPKGWDELTKVQRNRAEAIFHSHHISEASMDAAGGKVVEAVVKVEEGDVKQPIGAKRQRGGKAAPAEAPKTVSPAAVLSDYELERLEQIAHNKRRMMELQLTDAVAQLNVAKPVRAPPIKGISTKRIKIETQPVERRISARVRGEKPDEALAAGVDYETNKGVVLKAPLAAAAAAAGAGASKEAKGPSKGRHPVGAIPFTSTNCGPKSDAHFLDLLRSHSSCETSPSQSPGMLRGTADKLQLKSDDVAKITKDGITHIAFHPGSDKLILAAGDKQGNVGFWHVDSASSATPESLNAGEGDEDEGYDGVLTFSPHYQYISGLKWLNGGNHLATCSYDGSIRLLDARQGEFQEVRGIPTGMEISAMDLTKDGSIAYVGDNLGNMEIMDLRMHKPLVTGFSMQEQGRPRINTVHLEPVSESILVTSCSDATVRLWDVRSLNKARATAQGDKQTKPIGILAHTKSCQGAFFAPDGSKRLLTTSYDDSVSVTNVPHEFGSAAGSGKAPVQLTPSLKIKHNNQTGRWVIPFRAIWGPASDCALVGCMNRAVDVLSIPNEDADMDVALGARAHNKGGTVTKLESRDLMTAIPSRMCCHPTRNVVAAATSSGRVHIWR
eukprot:gene23956-9528_t